METTEGNILSFFMTWDEVITIKGIFEFFLKK
jgi:hypothetical protein